MAAKTKFYTDPHHGKIMGVCAGVADYTGWDVTAVRVCFVLLAFVTHAFLVAGYLLTAWLAPKQPDGLYGDAEDARFWQGVRANPRRSTAEVRSTFRDLDRRLADLETLYTSREGSLASEIDRLR